MTEQKSDDVNIWTEFENESRIDWSELWTEQDSYFSNVRTILAELWNHQNPYAFEMVALYACVHSVLADTLPILFFFGESGTGKSTASLAIAAMRNQLDNVIGASSTFASIRNLLNQIRWQIPESDFRDRASEKPSLLVWADIKSIDLERDPKIYSLLRNGFSRKEEKILIANSEGGNYSFYTFGQKVTSSVERFFTRSEYSELKRRVLPIECHKSPVGFEARPIDSVNWHGIQYEHRNFWNRENLLAVARLRKTAKPLSVLKKHGLTEHEAQITLDLALQYCVLASVSMAESAMRMAEFWAYARLICDVPEFSVDSVVKLFVADLTAKYNKLLPDWTKLETTQSEVLAHCGKHGFKVSTQEVARTLQVIGFTYELRGNQLYWTKTRN